MSYADRSVAESQSPVWLAVEPPLTAFRRSLVDVTRSSPVPDVYSASSTPIARGDTRACPAAGGDAILGDLLGAIAGRRLAVGATGLSVHAVTVGIVICRRHFPIWTTSGMFVPAGTSWMEKCRPPRCSRSRAGRRVERRARVARRVVGERARGRVRNVDRDVVERVLPGRSRMVPLTVVCAPPTGDLLALELTHGEPNRGKPRPRRRARGRLPVPTSASPSSPPPRAPSFRCRE